MTARLMKLRLMRMAERTQTKKGKQINQPCGVIQKKVGRAKKEKEVEGNGEEDEKQAEGINT